MGRNKLSLDVKGFMELASQFAELDGDLKSFFTDQFEQIGETIAEDTIEAVQKSNLPAGGKYSQGDTEKSIIRAPKVTWSGNIGSMPFGFDYGKPGSGGLLITGTPKMKPDYALEDIYARKKYQNDLTKGISDALAEEIRYTMKGG